MHVLNGARDRCRPGWSPGLGGRRVHVDVLLHRRLALYCLPASALPRREDGDDFRDVVLLKHGCLGSLAGAPTESCATAVVLPMIGFGQSYAGCSAVGLGFGRRTLRGCLRGWFVRCKRDRLLPLRSGARASACGPSECCRCFLMLGLRRRWCRCVDFDRLLHCRLPRCRLSRRRLSGHRFLRPPRWLRWWLFDNVFCLRLRCLRLSTRRAAECRSR
jgi:hypothetical protein